MDKGDMVHIYNEIQSKGSQKEKKKYIKCIYMESRKMVLMNLFSGKE